MVFGCVFWVVLGPVGELACALHRRKMEVARAANLSTVLTLRRLDGHPLARHGRTALELQIARGALAPGQAHLRLRAAALGRGADEGRVSTSKRKRSDNDRGGELHCSTTTGC